MDTVVYVKAKVVVAPTTTEEPGIGEATNEVVNCKVVDGVVVDGVVVDGVVVDVGQLIEDSIEYNARETLSTLNEERMKRLR